MIDRFKNFPRAGTSYVSVSTVLLIRPLYRYIGHRTVDPIDQWTLSYPRHVSADRLDSTRKRTFLSSKSGRSTSSRLGRAICIYIFITLHSSMISEWDESWPRSKGFCLSYRMHVEITSHSDPPLVQTWVERHLPLDLIYSHFSAYSFLRFYYFYFSRIPLTLEGCVILIRA